MASRVRWGGEQGEVGRRAWWGGAAGGGGGGQGKLILT